MKTEKNHRKAMTALTVLGTLLGAWSLTSCSSMEGKPSGKEIAASGPTILNERVEPKTIQLTRSLQPLQSPEIIADVKDFSSNIAHVKIRFLHVPLELPMKNIGGTTWRATLSPKDLQDLAVSGETMNYDASVVASNENGDTAVSSKPLTIAIKTPDLGKSAT